MFIFFIKDSLLVVRLEVDSDGVEEVLGSRNNDLQLKKKSNPRKATEKSPETCHSKIHTYLPIKIYSSL